jgi:tetratricopeptide (TPR) repeat protein
MLYQAYEQYEHAAICYERARFLAPTQFEWAYYLGTVRAVLGRPAEAAVILREALVRKPDYLPARLKLAESLLASAELEHSQRLYEDILKEHSDSALAHYGMGKVRAARRDLVSAVEHYKKACELVPNFGACHYALGLAYRDLGDTARAQEHITLYQKDKLGWPSTEDPLMSAVAQLKGGAAHHLKIGVSLEAAGQMKAAVDEHLRALEIDPKYVQAHLNLITLYAKLGEGDKAEKHYRATLEINPRLPESHYNFGVFLTSQQRNSEAAAAFNKALEINPYYAEAHNNYAFIMMSEGRLDEAERHFRTAIENKPNYRLAHFHLGRLLVHQGKTAEAIQHFHQTLTPEDESTPGYLYALGAAYARTGDRKTALHYIRQAQQKASTLGQTQLLVSIEKDLRVLEQSNPP